jgi:hypothetical protein
LPSPDNGPRTTESDTYVHGAQKDFWCSNTTPHTGAGFISTTTPYFKEGKKVHRSEAIHCLFGNYLGILMKIVFFFFFFFEDWALGKEFSASRVCQARLVSFSR